MSAINGRIKKLYKHKKKWARKAQIDSYRLYDRDIPDFPFIVDIHGPYCVIYKRGIDYIDEKKNHLPLLTEALITECNIEQNNIIVKERKVQDDTFQYEKKSVDNDLIFFSQEADIQFKLILNRYIDTGLFLDHRPLRQLIATSDLKAKKVLNLFCYTGSLSVAAAHAGATVTSVDMSNTYLNWAKGNFDLNKIPLSDHNFIREDVLKYLAQEAQKHSSSSLEKYDIIILDPPSMSKSKRMDKTFDIQTDQNELINNCMALLSTSGTLYFSNNLRSFKLDESIKEKYQVKDLTRWSIPQDFHDLKIHQLYKINLHS